VNKDSKATTDALIKALDDKDRDVRWSAIEALGKHKASKAAYEAYIEAYGAFKKGDIK